MRFIVLTILLMAHTTCLKLIHTKNNSINRIDIKNSTNVQAKVVDVKKKEETNPRNTKEHTFKEDDFNKTHIEIFREEELEENNVGSELKGKDKVQSEDDQRITDARPLKEDESSLGSTEDFREFKEENQAEQFAKDHGLISPKFSYEHLGQMRFHTVKIRNETKKFSLLDSLRKLNGKLLSNPNILRNLYGKGCAVNGNTHCVMPWVVYGR